MPRRPRLSSTRTFCRDIDGAMAVEFALIAVPFLGLCAAILQTGFMIWAQQNFERALDRATRNLLTGQFQVATASDSDPAVILRKLRLKMCGPDAGMTLFDCAAVKIDVTSASSFTGSTPTQPIDPQTKAWKPNFGSAYTCPRPGAIVVVTAAAKVPTFFGLLGIDLRTFLDGSQLLFSTAVFRTEPYETAGTMACTA